MALKVNKYGLVPCKILVGNAAEGIRVGEVRGLVPEIAQRMLDAKCVELVEIPPDKKVVRKPADPAPTA